MRLHIDRSSSVVLFGVLFFVLSVLVLVNSVWLFVCWFSIVSGLFISGTQCLKLVSTKCEIVTMELKSKG